MKDDETEPAGPAGATSEAPGEGSLGGDDTADLVRCILVVEDDDDTATLIGRMLASFGHAVRRATNGQEAILVTQNNLPMLVVMDVMMPHIDGFETTRYLKVRYPGYLPVMILTALDDAESVRRAQVVEADHYLTKPVRRATLQEAVELLVALSVAEDGAADDPAAVVEARLAIAEQLWAQGLGRVAVGHLTRLRALAPDDPRVLDLQKRLGE